MASGLCLPSGVALNRLTVGEQKYHEAVQHSLQDIQSSSRDADAWIQVMHAAIGHDLQVSENDTISVWEVIAALKKGLELVTGDANARRKP
jgi:hypothetical protein